MRKVFSISRARTRSFLKNETEGRIFSVYFQKVNGDMRQMVCRRGVTRHLRGGGLPYDPNKYGYLPVFDMEARDYRMVNLNSITSFRIGGEMFLVW